MIVPLSIYQNIYCIYMLHRCAIKAHFSSGLPNVVWFQSTEQQSTDVLGNNMCMEKYRKSTNYNIELNVTQHFCFIQSFNLYSSNLNTQIPPNFLWADLDRSHLYCTVGSEAFHWKQ